MVSGRLGPYLIIVHLDFSTCLRFRKLESSRSTLHPDIRQKTKGSLISFRFKWWSAAIKQAVFIRPVGGVFLICQPSFGSFGLCRPPQIISYTHHPINSFLFCWSVFVKGSVKRNGTGCAFPQLHTMPKSGTSSQ
jgi:hypothetical protein